MKRYVITEELLEKNQKLREAKELTRQGLLSPQDDYFWWFRENRLSVLDRIVKEQGTADNLYSTKIGIKLCSYLSCYRESIEEALEELGYDLQIVRKRKSKSFYNNFDNIEKALRSFIEINNRFPNTKEIVNELKICHKFILRNGGVMEVRRRLGYFEDKDYVDDNWYVNRSLPEFMIAQFLLHSGVWYERDKLIYQDYNYRSDFYFQDGTHLELWGYGQRNVGYYKVKMKKIELYKLKKISLIELKYEDFLKSYDDILDMLQRFFKDRIPSGISFDKQIFERKNSLSDDDIIKLIEPYVENSQLPQIQILNEAGLGHIVRYIRKRHKTYHNFGKKVGLINPHIIIKKAEVSEDIVYASLFELLRTKHKITIRNVVSYCGVNTLEWIYEHGGIYTWKLKFYSYVLELKQEHLPDDAIHFIYNIYYYKHSPKIHVKVTYTEEERLLAQIMVQEIRMRSEYITIRNLIEEGRPFREHEFRDNFLKYAYGKALTPKGFDEVSNISSRRYTALVKKARGLSWMKVVESYWRLPELDAYIVREYAAYIIEYRRFCIREFCRQHPYLSVKLMSYKSAEEWSVLTGLVTTKKGINTEEFKVIF
ncbi:hypothetical protein [Paenibacillus odorifer]|uniref:hypothetical protein n=1 Tax=Paenibacillus odorifer TaxID=189426 RepID=UPI00096D63A7|nr:hypothetical protein [Paenibacillus odorifer]OMD17947.1 hypothetical protein BJP47_16715 [Paenibacillus odorifer]